MWPWSKPKLILEWKTLTGSVKRTFSIDKNFEKELVHFEDDGLSLQSLEIFYSEHSGVRVQREKRRNAMTGKCKHRDWRVVKVSMSKIGIFYEPDEITIKCGACGEKFELHSFSNCPQHYDED